MASSNALTNLRGRDPGANRQTDAISRLVEPVAKAVMATPIMGAKPPAWIRPPLQSGFSDNLAGFAPARYHKDALGYVHVEAYLLNATGTLAGSTIFVLPPGYRPGLSLIFTGDSSVGFASLVLYSNGILANSQVVGAGAGIAFAFSFLAEN